MAQYIDKSAVVAEIERKKIGYNVDGKHSVEYDTTRKILSIIDTLEVKEVDLELITGWFDHIAQIADDRMTLTNQRMTDAHALDEIKCLAKNSSEFITKHYKAQKGEKDERNCKRNGSVSFLWLRVQGNERRHQDG